MAFNKTGKLILSQDLRRAAMILTSERGDTLCYFQHSLCPEILNSGYHFTDGHTASRTLLVNAY